MKVSNQNNSDQSRKIFGLLQDCMMFLNAYLNGPSKGDDRIQYKYGSYADGWHAYVKNPIEISALV